jgi:hypothetical protein
MYGFAQMDRSDETGDYGIRLLSLNNTVTEDGVAVHEVVKLKFQLTVPQGLHVVAATSPEGGVGTEVAGSASTSDSGAGASDAILTNGRAPLFYYSLGLCIMAHAANLTFVSGTSK